MQKYEEVVGEDGEIYLRKTVEWSKFQKNSQDRYRVEVCGLPIHVTGLELSDYIDKDRTIPRKLSKYISDFGNKYKNIHLYFWSHANGTQKTTTASIVGNELSKSGFSVQFILMGELIKSLTDATFDENKKIFIEKLKSCDFLIIDDCFDPKKATIYKSGYQISFLDQFLRERLEVLRKATCFTSNFSIDEINEDVFGISLKKLMKRSVLDPFEFKTSYEERNRFDPNDLWS